jgi:amino acid transporter
MWTVVFVIFFILTCIALIVCGFAAVAGAIDAMDSTQYNSNSNVRSGHQNLTIAGALAWTSIAVLLVIVIVAVVAGGFSTVEISDALLSKDNLSKNDVFNLYKSEAELSSGKTTQLVVLITMILVAIVTFIVGIMSVLAAIDLGNVKTPDDKAKSAYSDAVIASVAGVGSIGLMIVAVIAYVGVRAARQNQLAKVATAVANGEKALGITEVQLTASKS